MICYRTHPQDVYNNIFSQEIHHMILINHSSKSDPQKKSSRPGPLPAVLVSLVLAGALLAGCSGTGTMYTPEAFEEDSEFSDTGMTAAADASATEAPASPDEETVGRDQSMGEEHEQPASNADPDEESRTLRAELEGTGSDLYTVQAVEGYYDFLLDDVSFSLPSPFADFEKAGWELLDSDSGSSADTPLMIPSYSFEYVNAAPAGDTKNSRQIRLCLANFTGNELEASSCNVCGISVTQDSRAMLKTAFGAGIGDPLEELTSVFGTDSSCFKKTQYTDGVNTVRYHFSNGLNEGETIPVLAEAEDKSLAELVLAETAEDGSTIRSLSLYFFRLPE